MARYDTNTCLTSIDLIRYGIENVARFSPIQIVQSWVLAAKNFEERQSQVVLAHVLQSFTSVLLKDARVKRDDPIV